MDLATNQLKKNFINNNKENNLHNKYLQNSNKIKKINGDSWEDININFNVETPATGTHERDDSRKTSIATAKLNWEHLKSNVNFIEAFGYFDFHTNKDPISHNNVQLQLDSKSDNHIIWKYSDTNDHSRGWGHQTSTISITIDASYNEDEGIIDLTLEAYIYARTAGSVHSCSTTCKIDKITFLSNIKKEI